MKVVVTGATGNVGISVLGALALRDEVTEIVGVARRLPDIALPKVTWKSADVTTDDLASIFAGADSVIHLAWAITPMHNREMLRNINVGGSRRVFQAAAQANVTSVVVASSVGAYARGPKDHAVDESWPTTGMPTAQYSVDKAEVERLLDIFEENYSNTRWVRLRPGLVIKPEAASEIHRLFLGPLPVHLALKKGLPIVPDIDGFRFQVAHASDVGEAFAAAVLGDVRGAFNVAADPVIDANVLAEIYGTRKIALPRKLLRATVATTFKLRLQPTDPGWLDILLNVPVMDTSRAKKKLDWEPKVTATDAFKSFIEGFANSEGFATPPLHPR